MNQIVNWGIWKYEEYLPRLLKVNQVTLGEGQVPLIHSESIGKELGLELARGSDSG